MTRVDVTAPALVFLHLLPSMPEVLATGFPVGLVEWTCMEALVPFLESGESSPGTAICVTRTAPTPPGLVLRVTATITSIAGRRIEWRVSARDDLDLIAEGEHQRMVVSWERFRGKPKDKTATYAG